MEKREKFLSLPASPVLQSSATAFQLATFTQKLGGRRVSGIFPMEQSRATGGEKVLGRRLIGTPFLRRCMTETGKVVALFVYFGHWILLPLSWASIYCSFFFPFQFLESYCRPQKDKNECPLYRRICMLLLFKLEWAWYAPTSFIDNSVIIDIILL